mmetsp:Transcript_65092/g.179872  ORF Transcript_65092/g.179872 Transcript_65092/m.179872 type:complete len:270 (+) Transcript_65092:311-1120(+)
MRRGEAMPMWRLKCAMRPSRRVQMRARRTAPVGAVGGLVAATAATTMLTPMPSLTPSRNRAQKPAQKPAQRPAQRARQMLCPLLTRTRTLTQSRKRRATMQPPTRRRSKFPCQSPLKTLPMPPTLTAKAPRTRGRARRRKLKVHPSTCRRAVRRSRTTTCTAHTRIPRKRAMTVPSRRVRWLRSQPLTTALRSRSAKQPRRRLLPSMTTPGLPLVMRPTQTPSHRRRALAAPRRLPRQRQPQRHQRLLLRQLTRRPTKTISRPRHNANA